MMSILLNQKIHISDKLGSVSAEILLPDDAKCVMTLAHGAGAGMNHTFMKDLSSALAEEGIATVRYNLHYMEQGKKRPDVPAVAHAVIREVIARTNALYPQLPLIVSGKSFGGRMTSQLLAKEHIEAVKAIIFYGFPLHPANSPGTDRADHLQDVKVPMLFLQGTKDALANIDLLKTVLQKLPNATLEEIENADHSFKVGKKDAIVHLSKKTKNWLGQMRIL